MFEVYSNAAGLGSPHGDVGLGAIFTVNAGTYDQNGTPKAAFLPGEDIYFRAVGEPGAGVLVGWSRDGVKQQDLSWDGVRADGSGLAQWRVTGGPSGIGIGSFVYTIVFQVDGANPDPTAVLRFTIGAAAVSSGSTGRSGSTTTTPTNTQRSTPTLTQNSCPAGAYFDPLLNACVPIRAITNTQQQTGQTANACTPFGLEMDPLTGACVIPRTTTERYTGSGGTQEEAMRAAQQARILQLQVEDLIAQVVAAQKALTDAAAAGKAAAELAALQTRLDAANAALASKTNTAIPGGSDFALPSWLAGDWFGLPKPLVIGGAVLLAFMFKK